ncbi:MAG TPA: efflux RND transporter periplasmic adaptor subunit [Hyphomicrobiaceae bacterium]|nr:efflux RND transporter periplasmic adaptor subunit [Hyphomicrobiaceae bacterium]
MIRLLKRLLAALLLCAVAGVIIYVALMPAVEKQVRGRYARPSGSIPVPVATATARTDDVPIYLTGVGTAKARNTVTVRPQVDGKILSIDFKEGQEVKRGDVLARIDPTTYKAQLDQAVAKKALDDVQLANAKRDLERYETVGGNVVAQKTIDTQRALVQQLAAQIKQDEAAIANAKAVLDYTTILSPINGRTGIRMVDEGNLVRAADATGIVMITEIRPISVQFTLPQQQLTQVNKAFAADRIPVDALDGDGRKVLDRGVLQVIDNQVDQTTGTVRMKAEFPNADMQLWPGQFVNVRVLIETLKQVVVIPTPAVQRGPNGTFAYLVQPDNSAGLRTITIAYQDETQAVVSQGLKAGDQVVTTGFARLKDGSRLRIGNGGPRNPVTSDVGTPKEGAMAATITEEPQPKGKGRRRRHEDASTSKPREADAGKPEGSSTQ